MEFRVMTPADIPACARTLMAAFVQPPLERALDARPSGHPH